MIFLAEICLAETAPLTHADSMTSYVLFKSLSENTISLKDIIGWVVLLVAALFAFWQARLTIIGTHDNTLLQSRLEQHQKWADEFRQIWAEFYSDVVAFILSRQDFFREMIYFEQLLKNNPKKYLKFVRKQFKILNASTHSTARKNTAVKLSLSKRELGESNLDYALWEMNDIWEKLFLSIKIDITNKKSLQESQEQVSKLHKRMIDLLPVLSERVDKAISNREQDIHKTFRLKGGFK